MATRLGQVGLASEVRLELPFTQADIADARGLSIVHVNRTIQELRRRRLKEWEGKTVDLIEGPGLELLAEFDCGYLHCTR
jgi:CRP-like cAMP-binding protein